MDLCELNQSNSTRHPWESSRAKALKSIINRSIHLASPSSILDVGSGDGYIINEIFKVFSFKQIDAVDIQLSEAQIDELSSKYHPIIFRNNYNELKEGSYNIVLVLDVVEHVEDDIAFLCEICDRYASPGAYILITVPAFQFLYTSHDKYLKHFRRYNRKQLGKVVKEAGLKSEISGYLFCSLLPLRFLSLCYERIMPTFSHRNNGIGAWEHGRILTKIVEWTLRLDNRISLSLNRYNIKIPGLTVWTLCRKL